MTVEGQSDAANGTRPQVADPRKEWKRSHERRNFYIRLTIIMLAAVAAALIENFTYRLSELFRLDNSDHIVAWIIVAAAAGIFAMHQYGRYRDQFNDRQIELQVEELKEVEKEVVSEAAGQPLDLASLWAVNQDQLRLYHRIATNQSERSFRNGQIASYSGFITLIIVAFLAAFSPDVTGAIAAGVIGVAGAGLSGFIGATFMRSQSEASKQLQQFFNQPVEFSRMLGAERLVGTIPQQDRGEVVTEVVRGVMKREFQPIAVDPPVKDLRK